MGKESEIITDIIEPKTKPQTSYKDVKIDPTIPLKYKRNIERVLKKLSLILFGQPVETKNCLTPCQNYIGNSQKKSSNTQFQSARETK